jgi:hypothetical protein
MGLLDDAIREHLELKRRRGADPSEVERQENEALGDPRAPEAGAVTAGTEPADDVTGVTPERDLPREIDDDEPEPLAADEELDTLPEPAEPEPAEPEPAPAEPEPWLEDEPPTAEHPPAGDAPGSVAASRVQEEPPTGDEDVLEETPDFLQETPEHDRLWFEQKPPRDFDFDN